MTTPDELQRAIERLNETADWTAHGDPGGDGSVLLVSSVAAAHSEDLRLLLSERAELLDAVEMMREIINTLLETSKPDCPAGITARLDARAALTTGEEK